MNIPCLCIVFNHKYEQNLPKLRELYQRRFSQLLFLMPFSQTKDADVIPYYEKSHYFQACVTQGLQKLQSIDASHYVFTADDLILNPAINEDNVIERLGGRDRVSIPLVQNISGENGRPWERRLDIARISADSHGCEWTNLLPDRTSLIERMKKLGISHLVDVTHFRQILKNLRQPVPDSGDVVIDPVYPCLAGYSDVFIIPKDKLVDFAHYAGITSAMKLFAEVAIPTVSLMVSEELDFIRIEQRINLELTNAEEFSGKGLCLWQRAVDDFGSLCEYKMANAFAGPYRNTLFIHPIKLSRWA